MAESLSKEGIITDEEKDIVRFGLESLGGDLLGIILTLTIGVCFMQVGEALLLWIFLFPLRKNAGGYHATTKIRCLIMSAVILTVTFVFFSIFEHTMLFYGIFVMGAGFFIWMLAPVDNPSKELDELELKVYKKRTRIALVAEGAFFVMAISLKWEIAAKSICMVFFVVETSLLMGLLKWAIYNRFND